MNNILISPVLFQTRILTAVLLLVLFSPSTVSGQEITEQQIIGEWIFDFEVSLENMSEDAKRHYENLNGNHQANIQEAYQDRRFNFGADSSFIQQLANGYQAAGFWKVSENFTVEITSEDGRVIKFKVIEINDQKLILVPIKPDEGAANMLFSEWHLLRAS